MTEATLQARVGVHLTALTDAVAVLVHLHERVGRAFNSVLQKEGRATAVWELAGHALVHVRAYVVLLHGGYVPAAGAQARAVHEALLALAAVADPANEEIRERYLADHPIKAEGVRRSVQKTQRRIEAAGAEIEGDLWTLATDLYRGLRGCAHNRRAAVREAITTPLLVFAYGPHPSADIIASHVSYATTLFVHLVHEVSGCLSIFEGFTSAHATIGKPLVASLEALDTSHPLGSDATDSA